MLDNVRRGPGAASGARWLKCFKPNPNARWKLICFPFAGGGANFYRRWPEFFPPRVEVHAVQLPSREARLAEPVVDSAEAVSDAIIAEMKAICWRQPVALFGHSMGSMLAYDVARKLKQRHGWEPALLFASGRQPPHVRCGGDFHRRPDEDFIAEIKRLNGTPDGIFEDAEMRRIVLPMLRGDYAILENYRVPPGDPLTCPIVSIAGRDDGEVRPEEMTAWQDLTRGACLHRLFGGDHFYLKDHLPELSEFLHDCMSRLDAAVSGGAAHRSQ